VVTETEVDESAISRDWQRWAAETLMSGASLMDVVSTMDQHGMSEADAAGLCARILVDPAFDAGYLLAQQHLKLKSVVAMQSTMLGLSPTGREIDRRSGLSREEFLADYYAMNRPVVLEDICDEWPACRLWTTDYLADRLGSQPVEVMTGRDDDPDYEINSGAHREVMPFSKYISKMTGTAWGNDFYLVANNKLLETSVADPLWEDFTLDPRFMDPAGARARTFLWLGPAGTITPLHHDVMNVMFHQVDGWKRITLVAPSETPNVYNNQSVYSDVNPKAPDLDRFPAYADAHPIHVSVGPGEGLFIPVGWWHHVEALDQSVSVSSTSFAYPNQIDWFTPERLH
jgi:Cupin-like domain